MLISELDEGNNVSFEKLPVTSGAYVAVINNSDPNLADIVYTPSAFEGGTGIISASVEALLYDTTWLGETNQLCDITGVAASTELQGKIALVEKGICGYSTQINNAETLGAVAVLIYNDSVGGNQRNQMTGPAVNLPAGFLPHQDGLDLQAVHGQPIIIRPESETMVIIDPYK